MGFEHHFIWQTFKTALGLTKSHSKSLLELDLCTHPLMHAHMHPCRHTHTHAFMHTPMYAHMQPVTIHILVTLRVRSQEGDQDGLSLAGPTTGQESRA